MQTHERKLIQIGNSIGVTFPPEVLKAIGLNAGDWLELKLRVDGEIVITKSDLRARTEEHQNEVSQHREMLEKRRTARVRGQARVKK